MDLTSYLKSISSYIQVTSVARFDVLDTMMIKFQTHYNALGDLQCILEADEHESERGAHILSCC